MNRLILVGNGFDRYIGLNTDYPHLLSKVLHYIISELNPLGENILMKVNENVKANIAKSYKNGIYDFFNELSKLRNNNKIEIKSKFLEKLLCELNKNKWCDYETAMFTLDDHYYNDDEEKCINFLNRCLISVIKSENNRKSVIKNYKEKVNEIVSILNLNEITNSIDKTVICNFNYTDTFEDVAEQIKHEGNILYMHGNLKNEELCKFGYYFEDKDRASWRGIPKKSWVNKDSLTIEKNLLNNFVLHDEFELFIIGLSCGESDKKLLRDTILGSKNCHSVKVMKYDNRSYEDIVNNIIKMNKEIDNDFDIEIKPIDYPK